METLFDEKQHRYQLIALGWENKKRIHSCLVHIDIKDNKIWLQHDSTDAEIAKQLIERGIPATQIVLGFIHNSIVNLVILPNVKCFNVL